VGPVIVARGPAQLPRVDGAVAVSVGVFDGVHRGHQAVFAALRREADARTAYSVVVTLEPHPSRVLRPDHAPWLLTTLPEKIRLVERSEPDCLLVYPFDRETAGLSSEAFLARVVPAGGRLAVLVVGHDFRMGRDRAGGFEDLTQLGEELGFAVVRVGPTRHGEEAISSTRIRGLVAEGRVREAAELLGHRVVVSGPVVSGRGIGRTLQFPTANVDVTDERKLLPGFGIYAAFVQILEAGEELLPGAVYVGDRPTFGQGRAVVEVHLPGFSGDLAGRSLGIRFVERIREDRAFATPEELAAEIARDVERAVGILRAEGS
jgi:riboflavin kinase/FMN adenylyltransferase